MNFCFLGGTVEFPNENKNREYQDFSREVSEKHLDLISDPVSIALHNPRISGRENNNFSEHFHFDANNQVSSASYEKVCAMPVSEIYTNVY